MHSKIIILEIILFLFGIITAKNALKVLLKSKLFQEVAVAYKTNIIYGNIDISNKSFFINKLIYNIELNTILIKIVFVKLYYTKKPKHDEIVGSVL